MFHDPINFRQEDTRIYAGGELPFILIIDILKYL